MRTHKELRDSIMPPAYLTLWEACEILTAWRIEADWLGDTSRASRMGEMRMALLSELERHASSSR